MADRLTRLGASLLAGLLMCVSFPPTSWWWAGVPAIALLSWVLTRADTTLPGGFGYGLLFGLAFYLPLIPWISGLVGPLPWFLLATLEALFTAVFGVFAVLVARLPGWPLWIALVWSLHELIKSSVPFGGFPWGITAYGQANGPLVDLAVLGGAPLVSVAVALLGTSVCALGTVIAHRVTGADGDERHVAVIAAALIGTVLLGAALSAPMVRSHAAVRGDEPAVRVAAIQGNVPRLGLDFAEQRRAVLDNHVAQTLRLVADIKAGKAAQPRFVVWPENSSDIDPLTNPDAAAQIDVAAKAIGVPILVGTVMARPDSTAEDPAATNTILVWDPVTGPGERHDKQIVQPFGEYLPWRSVFSHLSSYADRAGYFVPGSGSGVLRPAGIPVGVATCWEVIFDRALRQSVRNGAQMLAVPTNNATFDQAMSEQQLAFARLRAVEHDRFVLVAGTTGISAAIAPDGTELGRTEFFVPAYLDVEVRLKTTRTVATRFGPVVQWVLAAAAIAAIGAAVSAQWWPRAAQGRPGRGVE
jgi:apolipoprotein N-acyltransferase